MTIRIAINGYGRIGRSVLRALYESKQRDTFEIVAINNTGNIEVLAHLTRHDTVHGLFPADVKVDGHHLVVNGDRIPVFADRDASKLPWAAHNVDVVLDCTGHYTSQEKASSHLHAGAKKVLISSPASGPVDATIVYGVNHHTLKSSDKIVSNASCTTNCLAPLAKALHEGLGIEQGLMTTIHAYTNDQVLIDAYHSDMHRARAATHSMIPTKTGAAAAIGLVLPELKGKMDGFAMRVPVINVSVVDLTFTASRHTNVDEVNNIVTKASESGPLKNILTVNRLPLVSVDFNHNPASSIFDATQTKVIGNVVKVLAWYDNEWGFSNRMLDTAKAMMDAQ